MNIHDMLTFSFKHRNMIRCIYSHSNLHTEMNKGTYSEPGHKLTSTFINSHVHGYDQHSHIHIHSCNDSKADVHIKNLTQMNMVIHSLTGEHATSMNMLTNSLICMNTEKHINTLICEQAQFTLTQRDAHIPPQVTHSLK